MVFAYESVCEGVRGIDLVFLAVVVGSKIEVLIPMMGMVPNAAHACDLVLNRRGTGGIPVRLLLVLTRRRGAPEEGMPDCVDGTTGRGLGIGAPCHA